MYVVYAKMRARTSDSDPHGKRSILVCLIYFFRFMREGTLANLSISTSVAAEYFEKGDHRKHLSTAIRILVMTV